ncbi:cardiolipin synthase [Akkermansiaceae bacterium]|nr:cardiolipin synthase [Akkermansiaceae bacterium]
MPEFVNIDPTTLLGLLGIVAFYVFGFLHILHALMNTRTSQGTIAWVVSLLTMPFLAIPLYWLLGRSKFSGYVRARRSNDVELRRLASDMHGRLGRYAVNLPEEDAFERAAEELGGLPFTRGNDLDLLIDGDETFARLFEAIAAAEKHVCVNFFIVKNDRVGGKFQQALIERARAGVKVYFLFDEIGSHKLSSTFLGEMEDAGVECESFGANRHWWSRLQLNFRNHRKIVVIDGKTAFIGGLNVGDEYLGRNKKFGAWRDTHLMMRGPAVEAVQLVFLEDWFWACDRVPELEWAGEGRDADQIAAVIPTGPADPLDSWKLLVCEAANTARERLWIASPYFVPDEGVMAALQLASIRGVDVRIMLPDRPDHILVWLSSYTYHEQAIPYRVKLFRYQRGFLHQKVMLIDGRMAAVGTANLDNRSFRLNFEITAFVSDAAFVEQVKGMLERDFSSSVEVLEGEFAEKPFLFRAACRAARLMAPLQ